MQQAEVSAATKQSSHLHSCLSSFAIVADDQQAIPVTAPSLDMAAGIGNVVDEMDMEVNEVQAVQSSGVSVPQFFGDSRNSAKRKSGRNKKRDRGKQGKKSDFDRSGCGDQRGEAKRSKTQL
jgi:hypothetical protein